MATSERSCVECGARQTTVPRQMWNGTLEYVWNTCPCREQAWIEQQAQIAASNTSYRQQRWEHSLGDTGLQIIRRLGMTLDRFNPRALHGDHVTHPFVTATTWIAAALEYGERACYHDPMSPPAALFFYSPTRGCGKTHLAGGLALEVYDQGKLVAFIEEGQFLRRYWGCPLNQQEQIVSLPGEQAWLTIIDDLGQREKASPAVADAWYAILNQRWLHGGWTIITSNYTVDELLDRGTINLSSYSRLGQMLHRQIVYFDGSDQRLTNSG